MKESSGKGRSALRPVRMSATRLDTSRTSASRDCMSLSSMAEKAEAKFSPVAHTAYSAVADWVSMM